MDEVASRAKGLRILVLDGFCKQCLPFIRGFRDLGCEVTVLCGSKLDPGYASRLPEHKILVDTDLKHGSDTESLYIGLAKSGKYDFMLPLFDNTSRTLAHCKEELSKYLYVCVNDSDTFDKANDKTTVMKVCMDNGIPCPYTLFNVDSVKSVAESGLSFPIIIKPRQSYGGRGFHAFDTMEELSEYVEKNGIDLSAYVVQERIPKNRRDLSCNVYIDRDGEVKSIFSYECRHMYPEVGGTSTLNALVDRPDVTESCTRLVKLMGVRGIVGVDVMIDPRDDVGKLIEINVRPAHGIALGFESGFDLCRQMIEDYLEVPVTEFDTLRTDVCMRIGQTDMLWFLTSKDRFRKSPRRMGFKTVKEQMFYWDDPMPWFAFLFGGLFGFKKTMKEKKQ